MEEAKGESEALEELTKWNQGRLSKEFRGGLMGRLGWRRKQK